MRIRNQFSEKIYWRAFKGDDTAYVVGLNQGSIDPNQVGSWRDDSFSDIKIEVKTGDIVFSKEVLVRAGQKFSMKDDLILTSDRNLIVAAASFENAKDSPPVKIVDVQFVDTRGTNKPMNREVTSTLQNTYTATQALLDTHSHTQTWTAGGKVGGLIGKKDEGNVSGEVSVQFQDAVVDSLQKSYTEQISSVWSKTVKDSFSFDSGFIYAIEVIWLVTQVEGSVSYFGQRTLYTVVKSANGSLTRPTAYKTVEEMPPDIKAKFQAFSA